MTSDTDRRPTPSAHRFLRLVELVVTIVATLLTIWQLVGGGLALPV
jgi:hypothetical protein